MKLFYNKSLSFVLFHPRLQIKYTGFRDRPHEERQARFQNACRDGRSEIVSTRTSQHRSMTTDPASMLPVPTQDLNTLT